MLQKVKEEDEKSQLEPVRMHADPGDAPQDSRVFLMVVKQASLYPIRVTTSKCCNFALRCPFVLIFHRLSDRCEFYRFPGYYDITLYSASGLEMYSTAGASMRYLGIYMRTKLYPMYEES